MSIQALHHVLARSIYKRRISLSTQIKTPTITKEHEQFTFAAPIQLEMHQQYLSNASKNIQIDLEMAEIQHPQYFT